MARVGNDGFRKGAAQATRDALHLVLMLAGVGVALYLVDVGCVFRQVTGLACPGCGMTRAWLSLLRLDVAAAAAYHPLFWVVPLAIGLLWAQEVCGRLVRSADAPSGRTLRLARGFLRCYNAVLLVLVCALLALWVIRLLDPADAGLLFGGVAPAGVEPDIVGWSRPTWMGWLGI